MKQIKYTKNNLKKLIVYPDADSNKYTRGNCVIVAGSLKYPGAAILSSLAAQRAGSGYTKLFTEDKHVKDSTFCMPSIPVDSFENFDLNILRSKYPYSFVCGPGFNPNDKSKIRLLIKIINKSLWPVLIDGGALSYFDDKEFLNAVKKRNQKGMITIITPHTGEALNIFKVYSKSKPKDTMCLASKLNEITGCIVVLKDSNTFIVNECQYYTMCDGTVALAKAGSGDVLAGILGGILCQNKIDAFNACIIASHIHAYAGIISSQDFSDISVCPQDLIDYIPKAIKFIQN